MITGSGVPLMFDGPLTDVHDTQKYPLGTPRQEIIDGVPRKFVYFENACYADNGTTEQSILQGETIYQAARASDANELFQGTTNISIAGCALVAAIAVVTVPFGYFGWAQVKGHIGDAYYDHDETILPFIRSTTGIDTAGEAIIGHSTDGEVESMGAGSEHLAFGFAMKIDTTFTDDNDTDLDGCEGVLTNCLWTW